MKRKPRRWTTDSSEAIGQLGEELDSAHPNAVKWREWSPLDNPVCRGCEFLPSCLGGCPRNQMQMREVQKKENCQYYQQHENRILASLPRADYERIAPHLEPVRLARGQIIYHTDQPIEHVYFPTGSMVSVVSQLADGSSVEVGVTGF